MRLRAIRGRHAGKVIVLDGRMTAGRTEDNDIHLADERTSRRHSEFLVDDHGCLVRDLDSRNGTLVNGLPVRNVYLQDGDEVLIGQTLFVYEERDADRQETDVLDITDTLGVRSSIASRDLDPLARRAREDPRAYEDRLRSIFGFDTQVSDVLELGDLAQKLFAVLREETPYDRALIEIHDAQGDVLYQAQSAEGSARGEDVVVSRTVVRHVLSRKEAVLLEDASRDTRFADRRSVVREGIRSALCVPLLHRGTGIGILYADVVAGRRALSESDLEFAAFLAERIAPRVAVALRFSEAKHEADQLRCEVVEPRRMLGRSDAMARLRDVIDRAAPTDAAVLIRGETGTGKELVARRVHQRSARSRGPFIAVNCAAIPEGLVEAELFGAERGAFSGAGRGRKGKFELAAGGTLFLDEVAEIPYPLQAKLLRVLEEFEFYRLGGQRPVRADVRIVAATGRNLKREIQDGYFREDLAYRLSVVVVDVPPLRARPGDVALLAEHFAEEFAMRMNRRPPRISEAALDTLETHAWPGNVRELRNAIERALIVADGDVLHVDDLPADVRGSDAAGAVQRALARGPITIREAERLCIIEALRHTAGRKGEAAKLLGISWPTLNKKIADYDIVLD